MFLLLELVESPNPKKMRNRTEMVTTTLPGSDNEEDASDLDDSEEDWKPVDKKVKKQLAFSTFFPVKFISNI